jgi:hypothetical protein
MFFHHWFIKIILGKQWEISSEPVYKPVDFHASIPLF